MNRVYSFIYFIQRYTPHLYGIPVRSTILLLIDYVINLNYNYLIYIDYIRAYSYYLFALKLLQ